MPRRCLDLCRRLRRLALTAAGIGLQQLGAHGGRHVPGHVEVDAGGEAEGAERLQPPHLPHGAAYDGFST